MDTFTCPGCNAPLKLALVPADEPFRQMFSAPQEGPAEVAAAATSEPETKASSPLADRPDIVAAKQGVRDNNKRCAEQLQLMIEETGGWFDALPSPGIFDKFQAWAVEKYGRPFEEYTKHRLSKVLVEHLGATWHKTAKGRMYLLPDGLRPSSRPASEDFPTVPVGPAPTSGPAPLSVVPAADNVRQLRPAPAAGEEWRCSSWLLAKGVPALQCELPDDHNAVPDGMGHQGSGYWWDEDSHGRLPGEVAAAPFVDFPETTDGGAVSVTDEGVFDSSGERLPGDDGEPVDPDRLCNSCVLPFGHEGPCGESWSPGDDGPGVAVPVIESGSVGGEEKGGVDFGAMLAAQEAAELEKGPDGVFRLPADNLAVAAQPVVAAAPLVDFTPDVAVYGEEAAQPPAPLPGYTEGGYVLEEPLRNVTVDDAGNVTAEGTFPAAVAAELAPPTDAFSVAVAEGALLPEAGFGAQVKAAVDAAAAAQSTVVHELPADPALPEGARLCSKQLTDEQIGWPLRRIGAILDDFAGGQGLVRLGALADIELRKIMGKNYATAMVCPAGSLPPEVAVEDAPADFSKPMTAVYTEAEIAAALAPAGRWYEDGVHYAVPLDPALKDAPFGKLEELFSAGLPTGYSLAHNGHVEVRDLPSGVFVTGPAVQATLSAPVAAPDVAGEDLQALVTGPDAAAAALAAYRAASAGLSVPDDVADAGDWG